MVFIVVDDLNDWIGVMGGHPRVKPELWTHLRRGESCSPMLTAMRPSADRPEQVFLHGLYPKSTGRYFNIPRRMPFYGDQPTQGITSPNLAKGSRDLPSALSRQHGYRVVSGGKVAHGNSTAKIKSDVDAVSGSPGRMLAATLPTTKRISGEKAGRTTMPTRKPGTTKVARWAIGGMERRTCKRQTVADDGGLLSSAPTVQCAQGLL